MTFYGGMSLNTGNYYGGGYTTGGYSYGNRVASSTNLNRVSRDITSGYSSDLEIINSYFKQGKTDKALRLYESLFDDVKTTAKNYGYSLSDAQVQTILNNAYSASTGSTLLTTVEDTTLSPFWTGVKEGIPIFGWFANSTSNIEARDQIAGEQTDFKDKFAEAAGSVISNACTLGAIGLFGGPVVAGIAAAAGAVVGIVKTILK